MVILFGIIFYHVPKPTNISETVVPKWHLIWSMLKLYMPKTKTLKKKTSKPLSNGSKANHICLTLVVSLDTLPQTCYHQITHFPDFEVILFLRKCHYRLLHTQIVIDTFFTSKILWPEVFLALNFANSPQLQGILDTM